MKLFYKILFACIAILNFSAINAQTFTVAGCSGTLGSSSYGPMYSVATANATNRTAIIYPATQLTTIAASTITNLYFNRLTASGSMAGTPSLKIYLKEVSNTDWGSGALAWDISTATLVFSGNPVSIVGTTAGWKNFPLSTNFYYTGSQNLAVFFEYTNATASTALTWVYEYTSPCVTTTNSNTTKYSNVTTGVLPTSLSSTDYRRPYIGFDYSVAACTAPPTPGTATSSVTNACSGANFSLGLTGNSTGLGQTYQWQSSTNGITGWNDISGATTAAYSASQSVTTYYRCAVTCGGNTQYSTSVQITSPALVSGTFTINSGQPTAGSNFQTFTDAFNYIKCGINGPVTFNVLAGSGPYNEQVKLDSVFGTSNTNTVTINGNGATLNFGSLSNATTKYGIHLNGADYVRINNLIVDGTASATGAWGIVLTAQADNNIISNCTINIGNPTVTGSTHIGIALNGTTTAVTSSGNNGNNNQFLNNNISGGYYNYYLYGNSGSATQNTNNVIKGGTLQDAYLYSVYAAYQSTGLMVDSLDISRLNRATVSTAAGVFVTTGCVGALIQRNKIHNLFDGASTSTSTSYGVYVATDATTANPTKIINNLIYNLGGNGTSYGIYNTGGDSMQVYHNTIALNDAAATTGTAYGIYQTTAATGIDVKDNIFYVTRSGTGVKRCFYFVTATTTFASNNNVFYMNAAGGTDNKVAQFGTTSYTTLADWQASNTNSYDQLSYELDPTFANAGSGDFKPTNSVMDSKGTPVGVLKDIVDSTRSTTTPDIGAYEFSTITAGLNFGAIGLVTPAVSSTGCYGSNETVTLKIKNLSSATHNFVTNPVTVTVNVTGTATQSFTTTVNTGTLVSDNTLDVVLPGSLNMSTAGVYTFNASTTLAGDVNTSNDAILPTTRTKVVLSAGTPSAAPSTFCAVGGTLPTLNTTGHTGYASLQWQVSNTSGSGYSNIPSATTASFATTTAITQNQYYILTATCSSTSVNSTEVTVTYVNPTIVSTTPGTRCGTGTVNIGATPSSGASISWYAAATGGSPLATGNAFTTPSISATTTYYASASQGGGTANIGPVSPSIGTNASSTIAIGTQQLFFDVLAQTTIQSVNVYPTAAIGSSFTIVIQNSAGTEVFNSGARTTTVTGGTTPQLVTLNAVLAPGTGYKFGFSTNPGMIRNSTGGVYPYTVPNVLSITGNSFDPVYYYFFYDWSVSSGCVSARTAVVATVDNTPGCSAVPVTLTNFKGEKTASVNKLSWTTLSEVNNAGFEVERSTDGINFGSIGFVAAASLTGNSNSALNYTFNDAKGFAINSYYRLKQLDKDGKFSYSTIVLLKVNKVKELTVTSIYPNPANAVVNVVVESPVNEKITLVVTDLTGKVVLQKTKALVSGNNIAELSINTLSSGSYFVKLICENGCTTSPIRFVKQ